MRKKITCSICGKRAYVNAPAKYCFNCARKIAKENARKSQERLKGTFGNECFFCGKKMEHIHHIDLNRKNNEVTNLLPLCWSCHSKVHSIILKPFIKKIFFTLKERRYTVIEIAEIIGLTRGRIYQILRHQS